MVTTAVLVLVAYLLGSISTAIAISRVLKLDDPRNVGSGNPGATNVLRYAGRKAAAVTLLGDALKGVIPVLIGHYLGVTGSALTLVAFAAFCGHLFPLYHGFKGGKGVATFVGVNLALSPLIGALFIVSWLSVAAITRYSSLAALVATLAVPIAAVVLGHAWGSVTIYAAMALLVFVRHHQNIQKLLRGEEKKIGQRA